jgi:2-(1,2-epoxy-1,2-dihydrophenyl)acetyl-CoA isomerase
MLMLSRPVSGRQAADWGLVHQSVPTDQVAPATRELVDELAGSATVAVGLTKLLVQRSLTATLDQHLADEAFALEVSTRSEDFEEYVRSRREHREPDYRGR